MVAVARFRDARDATVFLWSQALIFGGFAVVVVAGLAAFEALAAVAAVAFVIGVVINGVQVYKLARRIAGSGEIRFVWAWTFVAPMRLGPFAIGEARARIRTDQVARRENESA